MHLSNLVSTTLNLALKFPSAHRGNVRGLGCAVLHSHCTVWMSESVRTCQSLLVRVRPGDGWLVDLYMYIFGVQVTSLVSPLHLSRIGSPADSRLYSPCPFPNFRIGYLMTHLTLIRMAQMQTEILTVV
jgi:hypothetical protein